MSVLEPLLRASLVKPLGWTLVHFLWQGAVVAALLAGGLWLLRRRTAQARYLLAGSALLVMAAAPVMTMALLSSQPDRGSAGPGRLFPVRMTAAISPGWPLPALMPQRPAKGINQTRSAASTADRWRTSQALEPYLPWLVAAWLLGIVALSLRLLGGWVLVQRLARRQTRPVPDWLQARAVALSQRLGIDQPVKVLESAVVQVPSVIGWLRTVILVPAGALTGLPPQHLEALLAHEMAHIRRYDYLVNLIQTTVETLLFYHPAVWWVSQRIRIEREHCCDDLAVAAIGDRLVYARALATLEELRAAPAALALAGSGGDLLGRIRRILGLPAERHDPTSAWLAGMILLPLLLATAAALRASADGERLQGAKGGDGVATIVSSGKTAPEVDPPGLSRARRPGTVRVTVAPLNPAPLPAPPPAAPLVRAAATRASLARAGTLEEPPAPADVADAAASTATGTVPKRPGKTLLRRRPNRVVSTRTWPTELAPVDRSRMKRRVLSDRFVIQAADEDRTGAGPEPTHQRSVDLSHANLSYADLTGLDLRAVSLAGMQLSGVNLAGRDLRGKDLSYANLSGAHLAHARLARADLTDANLSGADLTDADFSHSRLVGANLSGAELHGTRLVGVDLAKVNISGAHIKGLDLKRVKLAGVNLSSVDLAGVDLSGQDLAHINLSGANLTGARLTGANLAGTNFSGANLTHTDLSHARLVDANLSGARLQGTRLAGVDLAKVNLSGADLSGQDHTVVSLVGANLSGVNLTGKNLVRKNLSRANLSGANLTGTRLSAANLTDANLSGADLTDADLSHARLEGANLSGANLPCTNLAGVDLSRVNLSGARRAAVDLGGVCLANVSPPQVDVADLLRETGDLMREIHAAVEEALSSSEASEPTL